MSPLRYQPEKVAVETAYVYEKANVDGSHKSDIAQYVSSKDSLEAFKWTECESEATLVTAKMDWNCFSVRELSPGRFGQMARELRLRFWTKLKAPIR